MIGSLLSNPRKTRVFSFIMQMWHFFKHLNFPSHYLSSNPYQPKIIFQLNPIIFKQKSLQNHFKVCFSKHCFHFSFNFVDFSLGLSKLVIFSKKGWVSQFCEKFSKILIGLSPIWCLCIYVGPMWQFEHVLWQFKHVLRQFALCSCILHHLCNLLHVRCLTKCPSDIFVMNWTQVSSNAWILSWLIMFIMFWSLDVYFTHCAHFVPQCHDMHTLSTLWAHLMHLMLQPHTSHAAHTCISTCSA